MADTLDTVLRDLVSVATEFIPRLLGAVVVMLVALVVALVLRRLIARFLETIGLDELFERTGASGSLWQLGYNGGPSRLLGLVIFWGVLLTGVAGALSVLGLSSLEHTMDQIVNLSGRALVALVVVIAGVMSAGWLSELVARESESAGLRGGNAFRRAVFITVVSITGLVAAVALGGGLVPLSGNIAAGRYVQEGISVGDEISVDGIEGTVEEIGRAAIVLRSEDGYLYRIPNRTLLEGVVRKRAG